MYKDPATFSVPTNERHEVIPPSGWRRAWLLEQARLANARVLSSACSKKPAVRRMFRDAKVCASARHAPPRPALDAMAEQPAASALKRGAIERQIEEIKYRILEDMLRNETHTDQRTMLHHAANEAAALAWMTPYPLLVLPVLLEEKVQAARLRLHRQQEIYRRSLEMRAE